MDAFATADDLGKLLNRTFSNDEKPWIDELLESASTYLREDVIGYQVYPRSTATVTTWPDADGIVPLPQHPVVSVDAVLRGGQPIPFRWNRGLLTVDGIDDVQVTFTYGASIAPEGLKRWACVIVSQTLSVLELQLGLTVGGLSSIQVDDFRVAFADAGAESGMQLHQRNVASIRRQYRGSIDTSDTR